MTTRRNFLRFGALAAVGSMFSGLGSKAFGQVFESGDVNLLPGQTIGDPLLTLRFEHFQPFVNTVFEIRNSRLRKGTTLWLKQVKEHFSKFNQSEGHNIESFSLSFEPVDGTQIPAGIYEFDHAGLGKFSLFVAPVSPDPNCYEAVITRLNSR